jgi:predicted O-methyltransferase YrrM
MVAENGSTMFFHCVSLYAFTRLIRPSVVVETGGTPGKSSAFILRALQRNGHGHLYTVDLPPRETDEVIRASEVYSKRPHLAAANWCVPDWLRGQHTLLLGPAETHLPRLLSQVRDVCVFIHDSNHSYAHVRWELETAFPFVRVAGFLWADDIGTNTAWLDFCEKHQLERHDFTSQGVARKR